MSYEQLQDLSDSEAQALVGKGKRQRTRAVETIDFASDNYTTISTAQTIDYSNDDLRWSDLPALYPDPDDDKKKLFWMTVSLPLFAIRRTQLFTVHANLFRRRLRTLEAMR